MLKKLKLLENTRAAPYYRYARSCYYRLRGGNRVSALIGAYFIPLLIRRQIERIAKDPRPIFVGPWLSEVGFEVLYWIPFLNWVKAEFGLPRDRVTVISRGGAAQWYENICSNYIDVFDYLTPEEFAHRNERRVESSHTRKQRNLSSFDLDVLQSVKRAFDADNFVLLHPSLMYRLFMLLWTNRRSISLLERHTKFEELPQPHPCEVASDLPTDYVAVKFYFSACFPDSIENRAFISTMLTKLAQKVPVVQLDTGLRVDDHNDSCIEGRRGIYTLRHLITPSNNLEVQTKVLARARAFIGTYGGFSYLAPFYGVPAISFYSNNNYLPVHLEVASRAFSTIKRGSFNVLGIKDIDLMKLVLA